MSLDLGDGYRFCGSYFPLDACDVDRGRTLGRELRTANHSTFTFSHGYRVLAPFEGVGETIIIQTTSYDYFLHLAGTSRLT